MARVGFIGTGHIAAPMARALARDGHSVVVSERNAAVAAELAGAGLGITVAPNQGVIDGAEFVFLCLRPAVWQDVVSALSWGQGRVIVSVMAGVPLTEIERVCAPSSEISATIPYGFIERGGCPLPVAGNPAALQMLFGGKNLVLPQADAGALQQYFAASALVSGVLAMLETASFWLASKTGNADQAEVYVSNLIAGVLAGLDKTGAGRLAAEKAALASPKTLNLQMVEGLALDGAFAGLPALLDRISASMEPK